MKIVLTSHTTNKQVMQVARKIKKLAGKSLYATEPIASKLKVPKSSLSGDLIVVIGGDGAILGAERSLARPTPILGIHTGTVGFLSEIDSGRVAKAMRKVLSGKYGTMKRVKLQPKLNGKNLHSTLNEVVVMSRRPGRICRLGVEINGEEYKTFDADGIIVATPTGSTAYALSAGGPFLSPETESIVIVPVCPYTLTARPIVIPDTSKIAIKVLEGDVAVVMDGQRRTEMKVGNRLTVEKARNPAVFVKFDESFYSKLNKLVR